MIQSLARPLADLAPGAARPCSSRRPRRRTCPAAPPAPRAAAPAIAFGRIAPFSMTRTNWPGRSAPFGIGQLGARLAGAGLRRRRARRRNASLPVRAYTLPSASRTIDLEAAVLGQLQAPGVGLLLQAQPLVVGDAEVDPDRVDLRHGGEQHVGTRHQRAFGALRAARRCRRPATRPACSSRLSRASVSRARAAFSVGLADRLGGDRVVELLLAHRLLGVAAASGARRCASPASRRASAPRDVGLGARERRLERRRVDGEERLALLRPGRPR